MGLQRKLRLRRSEDFKRLRETGDVFRHRFMLVSVSLNGTGGNRYGFVVSKQAGTAVTRNRARRLLREAVRALHPSLRGGFDVVIVARNGLIGQPLDVILRTVKQVFSQAGLVQEDES